MKIKKIHIYSIAVFTVIIIIVILYLNAFNQKSQQNIKKNQEKEKLSWFVDKDGYIYYPLDRGEIKFRRDNYSETKNLTVSRIIYQSTRGNVYGLLVLPKVISEHLPGIMLIPGAGVSKESELALAEKIAELGAVVLTIDQRGVGETDGGLPTLDEDFASFLSAKEPYQHLMVYDALRGYDLLYSAPFIDPERIIIAGESLGGRIAIIAAATDRNIKGVFVISSAGFDFKGGPDQNKNLFIKSIDSDHYIEHISPRKIVMMHNAYDKNIPLSSAIKSFNKAQEPKQFVLVNDTTCNHGYCDSMYNGLVDALDYLVAIRSKTVFSVPENKK